MTSSHGQLSEKSFLGYTTNQSEQKGMAANTKTPGETPGVSFCPI
jgi:hypothetical protein